MTTESGYSIEDFVKAIDPGILGFVDVVTYTSGFGFSCKKSAPEDEGISLLKISIFPEDLGNQELSRKPLQVSITYGKSVEGGVQIRGRQGLSEPLDLSFSGFYYDFEEKQLYRDSEKIVGWQLVEDVYEMHVRRTRPILGLPLRVKTLLFRVVLKRFFCSTAMLLSWVNFLISGDKYEYRYIFSEEVLNGRVVSSRFPNPAQPAATERYTEAPSIDIFGIKMKRRSAIVYALIHFIGYWLVVLLYGNDMPPQISRIFKNGFLTVVYVLVSFWLIEVAAPFLLRRGIKSLSNISGRFEYAEIKVA